ncbi:hypothetical protein F5884DRAFT_779276 [Xylogone sp. PMI_703]|nr:hypothetical protein F5884DRAFT_779276 [Xylogone sp. PMI_703]
MMRREEAYLLAHTARCKLKLAAGRPDRNLRFILGHAFTLDKLNLRLAEIETDETQGEFIGDEPEGDGRGYCTIPGDLHAGGDAQAKKSPPSSIHEPIQAPQDDEVEEDDEAEDDTLSLQRFNSGSARPPQMIEDNEDDDDLDSSSESSDESEYDFDFADIMPSKDELRVITSGPEDAHLKDLYHHVAKCPCHGKDGADAQHMWRVPQKEGQPQIAIMQVAEVAA